MNDVPITERLREAAEPGAAATWIELRALMLEAAEVVEVLEKLAQHHRAEIERLRGVHISMAQAHGSSLAEIRRLRDQRDRALEVAINGLERLDSVVAEIKRLSDPRRV